jgi:hypothetical protein
MAPSREAFHHADADAEETTPIGPLLATAASMDMDMDMDMERVVRVHKQKQEYMESLQRVIQRVPPTLFPWWWRLPFLGPDRNSIPVGQPLDDEQIEMLRK